MLTLLDCRLGEGPLAAPAKVDLFNLFAFDLAEIQEVSLTNVMDKAAVLAHRQRSLRVL